MQTETIPMSDKTDLWQKEIEDLATENSSTILAIVLGITREEAADKFLEIQDRYHIGGSLSGFRQAVTMARILGTILHTASKIQSHRVGSSSGVQFLDRFPTVLQWLEENDRALAILRAKNHFIYVGHGIVLSTDVVSFKQARITHVIFLNEEGE